MKSLNEFRKITEMGTPTLTSVADWLDIMEDSYPDGEAEEQFNEFAKKAKIKSSDYSYIDDVDQEFTDSIQELAETGKRTVTAENDDLDFELYKTPSGNVIRYSDDGFNTSYFLVDKKAAKALS